MCILNGRFGNHTNIHLFRQELMLSWIIYLLDIMMLTFYNILKLLLCVNYLIILNIMFQIVVKYQIIRSHRVLTATYYAYIDVIDPNNDNRIYNCNVNAISKQKLTSLDINRISSNI